MANQMGVNQGCAVVEALESRAYLAADLTPALALTLPWSEYRDFASDARGNFYLCGTYTDQTDFNPLRRKTYRLPGSAGMFVAKYRADGGLVWARGFPDAPPNGGQISSIAVDGEGNVFAAGRIYGTVDFDPGEGVRARTAAGGTDSFVWKLDRDGHFVSAAAVDQSGQGKFDDVLDLAVSRDGSVLLSGYWWDHTTEPDTVRAVVTKLSPKLAPVWRRDLRGVNAQGVAVDGHGNVLVTSTGPQGFDVTMYDRRGRFVWNRNARNTADGSGAAFDAAGNAFVHGTFQGDFTVDRDGSGGETAVDLAYGRAAVLFKYDPDGGLAWDREVAATTNSFASGVTVDRAGFVHLAGTFRGDVDLDGGRGTATGVADGDRTDAFLVTVDQSGRLLGGVAFGERGRDDSFAGVGLGSGGGLFAHAYASAFSLRTGPAGVRVFRVEE